jgi:hypothetical protein
VFDVDHQLWARTRIIAAELIRRGRGDLARREPARERPRPPPKPYRTSTQMDDASCPQK